MDNQSTLSLLRERALVCCHVNSLKQIESCREHRFIDEEDVDDTFMTSSLIIERSPRLHGHLSLELFADTFKLNVMVRN